MAKEINVKLEIEIPAVPNFLMFANQKPGRRQDGPVERPKIDVADVDDESLREIGAQWTQALLDNAKSRRVP